MTSSPATSRSSGCPGSPLDWARGEVWRVLAEALGLDAEMPPAGGTA